MTRTRGSRRHDARIPRKSTAARDPVAACPAAGVRVRAPALLRKPDSGRAERPRCFSAKVTPRAGHASGVLRCLMDTTGRTTYRWTLVVPILASASRSVDPGREVPMPKRVLCFAAALIVECVLAPRASPASLAITHISVADGTGAPIAKRHDGPRSWDPHHGRSDRAPRCWCHAMPASSMAPAGT